MKKFFYLLFALLLFAGAVHAQTTDDSWWNDWNGRMYINLVNDNGLPVDSLHCWLSTSDVIYMGHDDPSYDQRLNKLRKNDSTTVIITKENNDTVYLKDFGRPSIQIDMNYILIPKGNYKLQNNGNYTMNVFWHDTWWRADFTFKSHWPEGEYVYVDSVYYRLNSGYATTVWPDYFIGRSITLRRGWDWCKPTYRDYPDHLVIPEELTYEGNTYQIVGIDQRSFKQCYYLLSVKLPNTITHIDGGAFMNCPNLRRINIPPSVTSIGECVFSGCERLTDIVIPEGITVINHTTFEECTSLSAITLPSSLKSIEEWAFRACASLPYIDIPDNVTSIGENAFGDCKTLMEMHLPKSLKEIKPFTFRGCESLTSVVIPQRVRSIGEEAFAGCTKLASVTLPESLTKIGDKAFADIPNSGHIRCDAKEPFTISANTFNYKCTLHVPYGCKEKYENAAFWSNFTNIVEMDEEKYNEPVQYGETGVAPAVSYDAASDGQFYDLQGRPADGTKKGLYIRNGKKVLVK